jgi:hypothetical protein
LMFAKCSGLKPTPALRGRWACFMSKPPLDIHGRSRAFAHQDHDHFRVEQSEVISVIDSLLARDRAEKPVSTFPDHAPYRYDGRVMGVSDPGP